MIRILTLLVFLVFAASASVNAAPISVASSSATGSASEQYVAASEQGLEKLIVVMREFMRDQKNMGKAMAIMAATREFEANTAAGYDAAKASAGDNKELLAALESYREYQVELTHGRLGNADENDWDGMVAESRRRGEVVRAAARPPVKQ
jgi:hypothetical protein